MNENKEEHGIVTQMMDAIIKKEEVPRTEEKRIREEKKRKRLAGRAVEYLMFMNDDE